MTTVKKIFMEIVRALLFCCILSLLMTDFAASQANLCKCQLREINQTLNMPFQLHA